VIEMNEPVDQILWEERQQRKADLGLLWLDTDTSHEIKCGDRIGRKRIVIEEFRLDVVEFELVVLLDYSCRVRLQSLIKVMAILKVHA